MTLAKTTTLRIIAMILALAAVGAMGLWGLIGLNQNLAGALGEYDQLRQIYTAGLPIASARESLRNDQVQVSRAVAQILTALQRIEQLPQTPHNQEICRRLCADLDEAAGLLHDDGGPASVAKARGALNHALNEMGLLVNTTRKTIERINTDSAQRLRRTIGLVGAITAVFVVLASVIGIWQYRGVIGPLRRLDAGAKRLASGRFDERLPTTGYAELAELSAQFNRMAGELQSLYGDLEQKVRHASAELARSERLASVGYLAAGVAHEINNPLAIIATHAELSLDQLKRSDDAAAIDDARQALRVICDEAFRCKSITEKLLGLARRQPGERRAVALREVAGQVARMVSAMPEHRPIDLTVDFDDDCTVYASAGEMTQVLLNLAANAMAAVDRADGRVRIVGATDGPTVRITVEDNGRGMDESTLGRIFEPFYTSRPAGATGVGGTGLGLSIVHAIITDHGGRITAESDGPGRGSRFTIELPSGPAGRTDAPQDDRP